MEVLVKIKLLQYFYFLGKSTVSVSIRVTILGEISKFGLLFKAQVLVCCRYFKSFQVQGISCTFWTFKLSSDDIFWQLFWLLFPNFGRMFFHSSGHPGFNHQPSKVEYVTLTHSKSKQA
jgi:hypothetical protein